MPRYDSLDEMKDAILDTKVALQLFSKDSKINLGLFSELLDYTHSFHQSLQSLREALTGYSEEQDEIKAYLLKLDQQTGFYLGLNLVDVTYQAATLEDIIVKLHEKILSDGFTDYKHNLSALIGMQSLITKLYQSIPVQKRPVRTVTGINPRGLDDIPTLLATPMQYLTRFCLLVENIAGLIEKNRETLNSVLPVGAVLKSCVKSYLMEINETQRSRDSISAAQELMDSAHSEDEKRFILFQEILSLGFNSEPDKGKQVLNVSHYLKKLLAEAYPKNFNAKGESFIQRKGVFADEKLYQLLQQAFGWDDNQGELDFAQFSHEALVQLSALDSDPLWIVLRSTIPVQIHEVGFNYRRKFKTYIDVIEQLYLQYHLLSGSSAYRSRITKLLCQVVRTAREFEQHYCHQDPQLIALLRAALKPAESRQSPGLQQFGNWLRDLKDKALAEEMKAVLAAIEDTHQGRVGLTHKEVVKPAEEEIDDDSFDDFSEDEPEEAAAVPKQPVAETGAAFQAEIDSLNKKLQRHDQLIYELEQRVAQVNAEKKTGEAAIEDLEQNLRFATEQGGALTADINGLKEQLIEHQNLILESNNRLAALQAEKTQLQTAHNQSLLRVKELENTVQSYKEQVTKHQKLSLDSDSKLIAVQDEKTRLQTTLVLSQSRVNELEKTIQSYQAQESELNQRIEQLSIPTDNFSDLPPPPPELLVPELPIRVGMFFNEQNRDGAAAVPRQSPSPQPDVELGDDNYYQQVKLQQYISELEGSDAKTPSVLKESMDQELAFLKAIQRAWEEHPNDLSAAITTVSEKRLIWKNMIEERLIVGDGTQKLIRSLVELAQTSAAVRPNAQ